MELLLFYKFSFLVAFSSASSLSILGHHQLVRGKVLEIFALSQFALIGNLLAKLIFHSSENGAQALIVSYVSFSLGKLLLSKIDIQKNIYGPYMVGIYLCIISVQYLLIGFFPQLDSHMSLGFFGNMVTSSFMENIVLIVVFLVFFLLSQIYSKEISRRSLDINIFKVRPKSTFDLLLFSILLVVSLYGLGFLYTLSFLLIPNLILGTSFKSQRTSNKVIALMAATASVVGLLLSIVFENISTSSAQILLLFIMCLILKTVLSKSHS